MQDSVDTFGHPLLLAALAPGAMPPGALRLTPGAPDPDAPAAEPARNVASFRSLTHDLDLRLD